MAKEAAKTGKLYRVTLVPGDNPRNEYIGKKDFIGQCADEKAAVESWKTLNGLEGIGVEAWPLTVSEAEEEEAPPAPPKAPVKPVAPPAPKAPVS